MPYFLRSSSILISLPSLPRISTLHSVQLGVKVARVVHYLQLRVISSQPALKAHSAVPFPDELHSTNFPLLPLRFGRVASDGGLPIVDLFDRVEAANHVSFLCMAEVVDT